MKKLYAVPWIEVEYGWGSRPEGYKVFDNFEECIQDTLKSSETGNYKSGDGYFGPERPLSYYEFYDNENILSKKKFPCFVDNIEYKSPLYYIKFK